MPRKMSLTASWGLVPAKKKSWKTGGGFYTGKKTLKDPKKIKSFVKKNPWKFDPYANTKPSKTTNAASKAYSGIQKSVKSGKVSKEKVATAIKKIKAKKKKKK